MKIVSCNQTLLVGSFLFELKMAGLLVYQAAITLTDRHTVQGDISEERLQGFRTQIHKFT